MISPGAHTIKAKFNGMTLEENVDVREGETEILVFMFERTEFNISSWVDALGVKGSAQLSAEASDFSQWEFAKWDSSLVHNISLWATVWREGGHAKAEMDLSGTSYMWELSAAGDAGADIFHHYPYLPTLPIGPFSGFDYWIVQQLVDGWYPTINVAKEPLGQPGCVIGVLIHGPGVDGPVQNRYYSTTVSSKVKIVAANVVSSGPGDRFVYGRKIDVDTTISVRGRATLKMSSVPYDMEGMGIRYEGVHPPTASFTYSPEQPMIDGVITFDASNSSDPDGTIVKYNWNFGDGTSIEGAEVTHTYNEPRDYTVTLTVTDNEGFQGHLSKTITVIEAEPCNTNLPPVAHFDILTLGGLSADDEEHQYVQHQILRWDASETTDDRQSYSTLDYFWPYHEGHSAFEEFGIPEPGGQSYTITARDNCGEIDEHEVYLDICPLQWGLSRMPRKMLSFRSSNWSMGSTTTIKYYVNYLFGGTLDIESEWSELQEAFRTWEGMTYSYMDGAGGSHSGIQFVVFVETNDISEADIYVDGWGWWRFPPFFDLGVAYTAPNPGRPADQFIIRFNDWKTWTSGGAVGGDTWDVRKVAIHEIGHALGMCDFNLCGLSCDLDIMHQGNRVQRNLSLNDIAALVWLYGPTGEDLAGAQSFSIDNGGVPFDKDFSPPTPVNLGAPPMPLFAIAALSPVDVSVEDPAGRSISATSCDIPEAYYLEIDATEGKGNEKIIGIPNYIEGIYSVVITPDSTALPTDQFSILVAEGLHVDTICYNVTIEEIPSQGYLASTLDTGSVWGEITNGSSPLLGVPVDLYDSMGALITNTTSDDSGWYQFAALDNGTYSVSISAPLGYQADEDTKVVKVKGLPHEVSFQLNRLEIPIARRGRGYWMHQVNVLLSGIGDAQETYENMCNYMELTRTHFNEHGFNPVNVFDVDLNSDCDQRLEALRAVITPIPNSSMNDKAKAHLTTVLLNMVSGKIAQWEYISEDSATVSQAITYCNALITDTKPENDETAKNIAEMINEGQTVPASMIDLATANIAYKQSGDESLPTDFSLHQNHPNPFNPITEISFSLPSATHVKLEIYNIMGQLVATLADRRFEAGQHTIEWNGSQVASGVYLYRLRAGDFVDTKKMILLK